MQDCKPISTPFPTNVKLSFKMSPSSKKERMEMSRVPYASAVGSLMFVMICTRPDIAHAVGVASQYMAELGREHWEAVKRILRYIKGTSDVALFLGDSDLIVNGYVNSDYTGDLDRSKSTIGYVFTLSGETVSWGSKLQSVVAMSTTEAKYVAAAQASKEAVWLKTLSKIVPLSVFWSKVDFNSQIGHARNALCSACFDVEIDPKEEDHSEFRNRVFLRVSNLKGEHLLNLINKDVKFNKLDDEDDVQFVLDDFINGCIFHGENIYESFFHERVYNVAVDRRKFHLDKLASNPKYKANYVLHGFVFPLKIWALETFSNSLHWWRKSENVIPRGVAWSNGLKFEKSSYDRLFYSESSSFNKLTPSAIEMNELCVHTRVQTEVRHEVRVRTEVSRVVDKKEVHVQVVDKDDVRTRAMDEEDI
ncbi:hypothetical protein Tco_1125665 [Tanacetum coccineum]|uniref:Retrovirus-related Pol polyprotein from transposon TNT 1-94 n=1 Tax=Tanacetum coccineum TaxID=301880 RepID=A0ABQ5JAZ6_9ASTR